MIRKAIRSGKNVERESRRDWERISVEENELMWVIYRRKKWKKKNSEIVVGIAGSNGYLWSWTAGSEPRRIDGSTVFTTLELEPACEQSVFTVKFTISGRFWFWPVQFQSSSTVPIHFDHV